MLNPKNMRIFGTLLVVIGLVGSLATYRFVEKQETKTLEIDHANFNSVEVIGHNAEVIVTQTNEQQPSIQVSGYNLNKNFSSEVKNHTLWIKYEEKSKKFVNFGIGQNRVEIQVFLPKDQYEKILAEASSGIIHLSNLTADAIHAKSNNGTIDLKNSQSNRLEMRANNGKIDVEQFTGETVELAVDNGRLKIKDMFADAVNASSKNGKIELVEVGGTIKAQSDNGKIHFITKQLESPIDFTSKNGKIHIETMEEPKNIDLNAEAKNGSIKIYNEKISHQKFGAGEHQVNLQSHNGRIIVETQS